MKPSKLAHKLSYVVAAIMLLLPFQALLTTWVGSNTGHLDLIRIWKELIMAGLIIPVGWLIYTSPQLKTWFFKERLLWLFRAYILLHLALGWYALAHHQLNATSFIYALIINLRFFVFFIICYVLASRSSYLKDNWLKILLIPAGVVVLFGLAQQFVLPYDFLKHFGYSPSTIPAYQTIDSDLNYQRIQSALRGPNPLGAYLLLIIPVLFFIKNVRYKVVGLATALLALFYSYSRSAWLGTLAALSVLATWKFKSSRRTNAAIGVVVTLILLVGLGAYAFRANHTAENTLFHTNNASTTGSPNTKHSDAIKAGVHDVIHQPLGSGPGTAGPASFRNSGHPARISENYYLQIGQEVGILGMVIFIAINILMAKELWLRRQDVLAKVLLASLAGISLVNLVSHGWTDDTLSLLWWGLAGILLARHKQNEKNQKRTT